MHSYLRAVGFSSIKSRKAYEELIQNIATDADNRAYTSLNEESTLSVFSKEFAPGVGISICGQIDEDNNFYFEYAFPYVTGDHVSTTEDASIEKHIARESYAGVMDDPKIGVTIIFFLQNIIPYVRAQNMDMLPIKGTTVSLSALSIEGSILMPLQKNEASKKRVAKVMQDRFRLVEEARNGNEDAIESLTLGDMDTYSTLHQKMKTTDVYSLVDTYFMPYGVECDLYSVLGEITSVDRYNNLATGETLVKMNIDCNDVAITVCINEKDLYGEPEVERRFKGIVWLQGFVNNI